MTELLREWSEGTEAGAEAARYKVKNNSWATTPSLELTLSMIDLGPPAALLLL
jgi:hypothetical protein